MGTKTIHPGFRKIARRDNIFHKRDHDTFKIKDDLSEPTVFPHCGAVNHEGRWQWRQAHTEAHQLICPACRRVQDHYLAGFLTLQGAFFVAHRDEILH